MELLLGCGALREKRVGSAPWTNLVTLDVNPEHHPDVLHDLECLPLPFEADAFEEIHAYEVLEHTGQQGDFRFFFEQFTEFWRILKPNGLFAASVPLASHEHAWGDPGHRRMLTEQTLVFLDQAQYAIQVGHTWMSDYRWIFKADFGKMCTQRSEGNLFFSMRAIKPSRYGTFG
jgi:SAM-dependent methyltransferase